MVRLEDGKDLDFFCLYPVSVGENVLIQRCYFLLKMKQMEKAVNHYNGKKELLQETQEQVVQLKHSLEHKEREVKAITMETKVLQMDLDKAKTNEKTLLTRLASLEAQVSCQGKLQ